MNNYILAGNKPWNRDILPSLKRAVKGQWHFCGDSKALAKLSARVRPRYVFFLHWSTRVPDALLNAYECVCFHMTDVPYGRGGTPLQNLIIRGHRNTKLTALRMTSELDAGPVYMKRPLSLTGRAEDIYKRATAISAEMIQSIARKELRPRPQKGKVVIFKRRKPEESEIPPTASLAKLYDFIRMLDAPGYPNAFIDHKGFRYQISNVKQSAGRLFAQIEITQTEESAS